MRKPVPQVTQDAIFVKSRRRCCVCFGLHRDMKLKAGQIAHLDKNSANSSEDNLAFMCFDHHDQYDSTTRQSKNLSMKEVKHYRTELYSDVEIYFGLGGGLLGQVWLWLMDRTTRKLR